ncbi:MAG: AbrB/MazE/SpoVT family DNA-binding domain-containing protein [Euryarchaeota archaeon]|nr:AbrB/MazE/SpoVT family DNA-binding domain-containing protein [Euryarchaeota archaeon]
MTVTVTRNTQVTIPKKIREKLGIRVGDRVEMTVEDGKIVVRKVKPSLAEYRGFLPRGFEEALAELRKDSRDRFKRLGVVP